jgi:hypothetical protein
MELLEGRTLPDKLHRNVPMQHFIMGAIDNAHASFANFCDHAAMAERPITSRSYGPC